MTDICVCVCVHVCTVRKANQMKISEMMPLIKKKNLLKATKKKKDD